VSGVHKDTVCVENGAVQGRVRVSVKVVMWACVGVDRRVFRSLKPKVWDSVIILLFLDSRNLVNSLWNTRWGD
jgi:hypothetical protein